MNDYFPGDGIPPHHDNHDSFTDIIVSISMLSGLTMVFAHPGNKEKESIYLEPKSILIMTGESRYVWNHSIPSRKMDKFKGETIYR